MRMHLQFQKYQTCSFEVPPYVWAPTINGNMGLDGDLVGSVKFSPNNAFNNLKSSSVIVVEAHKGNWFIMG